jgi:hypothetical protein
VLQHALGWGRTGKATDVLIDCAGIALGLVALRLLASGRRQPAVLSLENNRAAG